MQDRASNPWRELRARIDLARWTTPPKAIERFAAPRILTVDGFAPARICDWLIGGARPRLKPAEVYNPETGERLRADAMRNNSVASFDITHYDVVMLLLRTRIAALARVAVDDLEPPSILHYTPGQQFGPHFDYLDPAQPSLAENIRGHGQRVGTFLLYLNDGYAGGETDFSELGWRYKGAKGGALLFWSASQDGILDRRTLHAGLTPISGEKWVLSQWIRRKL